MTRHSTIQWQIGTPKHPGRYLVTTKYHEVEFDMWRSNTDEYGDHWIDNYDTDVIAWCFIEDIEPFKF